jgi:DNA-binding transcriptional ArsR family regulator
MLKRYVRVHSADPAIAQVAASIGDPARAAMLCALFDGEELTAAQLASRAGIAANAASAHFTKLRDAGLITMRAQGRQRLFRLANRDVAYAIEALSAIAPRPRIVSLTQSRISAELQAARSCYDHLAGRLGVAVTDALVRQNIIRPCDDRAYELAAGGTAFFEKLGVDVSLLRKGSRRFARQCIDWSERRPHLAGALGAAVSEAFVYNGWIEKASTNRALRVNESGRAWLARTLHIAL